MPGARVDKSPVPTERLQNITAWSAKDMSEDTRKLNGKDRKRFRKRKAAVIEYFTTTNSLEEIGERNSLPALMVEQWAKKCLKRHEDGKPWGFRALVPGTTVVDHPLVDEKVTDPGTNPPVSDEKITDEHPVPKAGNAGSSDTDVTAVTLAEIEHETSTDKHKAIPHTSTDKTTPETPIPPFFELDEDEGGPVAGDEMIAPTRESDAETTEAIEVTDAPVGEAFALDIAPPVEESVSEEEATTVEETVPVVEDDDPTLETHAPTEDEIAPADVETTLLESPEESTQDEDVPTIADAVAALDDMPLLDVTAPLASEPTTALENEQETVPLQPVNGNGKHHQNGNGTGAHAKLARPTRPIPVVALTPTKKSMAPATKKIMSRRMVHKHWVRTDRKQHKRKRMITLVSLIAVALVLIGVALPVGTGLAAYNAYSNIRGIAYDGINHLMSVKDLLSTAKSNPMGALNAGKLKQAQGNFVIAEGDFLQLQQLVNRSDVQSALNQFAPQYDGELGMAQRLVQVAIDVSRMGDELSNVGILGANIIHSSPLASGSSTPLITAADIATIEGSLVHAQYYINDIQTQMKGVSLNALPFSASQKSQLSSILVELPKIQNYIGQAQGLIPAVSWLLGIGQPRRFLVQTLDNAELRPGGGFTGQYGVLTIDNGRVGPLGLTDVAELDYNGNGTAIGLPPPPGYSWMNFGNWGVRDSNLSADVPTNARMVMQDFENEGGGPVDGDITFTPTFIGHLIDITGPIYVADYGETITATNLADRLHYYQQNQAAISREQQISKNFSHTGRKAFTSLLGKLLLDKVRALPVSKLQLVLKAAQKDIQSRDLNIYFNNATAENWLLQHSYGGAMNSFSSHDGFEVVQANISISKASQFVHTTEQDSVTLDAQGGATHNLTITLNYQQTGPVYGYDTYADYIRVYAPANAQFLGGNGFDTGQSLCKPTATNPTATGGTTGTGGTGGTGSTQGTTPPPTVGCSQYNYTSPDTTARYCPNGDYALGMRGYRVGQVGTAWPIDSLGAPTEMTSDLPGHAMWGGLTETPKNCISYITLSWYVPHVVTMKAGQSPYSLIVGKQGGLIPTIQINVDDSAIKGLKPFGFKQDIIADTLIALPKLPAKKKL